MIGRREFITLLGGRGGGVAGRGASAAGRRALDRRFAHMERRPVRTQAYYAVRAEPWRTRMDGGS